MSGACGATPRLAAAGCAKACCPRRWRYIACTSRRTVHRHAPGLAHGTSTPRLKLGAASCGRGAPALSLGCWPCRIRAQAGETITRGCRVGHVSFRERSACTSLVCCESWRGYGCALGFMAATFQRKQFPRRCAASSRDKLFALPGSPRCCDRCAVRPAHPPPTGSQQGRTGAILFNPKGNHHG
jgi:hypothetical protein